MSKTPTARSPRPAAGSRPRPELRKGGKPAISAGHDQRDEKTTHLMDHLTLPRIAACLIVFLVVVCGAFYFQPEARNQRLGVKARSEMRYEHWDKSLAAWQPLYDQFPESPLINSGMARCYLEAKKPDLALKHLDQGLANADKLTDSPNEVSYLHVLRGWALLDLGRTQEGVDELQKELSANPDQPMANLVFGRFLAKNNDPVRAGLHFQRLANRPEYKSEVAKFKKQISDVFLKVADSELTDVPEKVSPTQVSSLLASTQEQKPAAK